MGEINKHHSPYVSKESRGAKLGSVSQVTSPPDVKPHDEVTDLPPDLEPLVDGYSCLSFLICLI